MELGPYEYRDPGRLLTQVMAERALVEHELVLVLIRAPSLDQQIVRTVRFTETPPPQVDHRERSAFLRRGIEQGAADWVST